METTNETPKAVVPFDPTANSGYWCSMQAKTDEQKALIYTARMQSAERLTDMIGDIVPIEHILVHNVEIEEDGGELRIVPRVVLITPGGQTYGTLSTGVFTSISALISIFGPPPWAVPKDVKVVEEKTNKGRKIVKLELVNSPKVKKGGKAE